MFHFIVNKFNKQNNSSTPERETNCDLILSEMTEIASRDLALRYESDKNIVYCLDKTDGDILTNLVLLKGIFSNKTYRNKWLGEKINDKIMYIIPFLHEPYSNYVRNYAMDVFRVIFSDVVELDTINLIIIRNAIEESYDKNPIEEVDDSVYNEKFAEFSAFLATFFSENARKIQVCENSNSFFKSRFERKAENISGSIIGNAVGNSIGLLVEGQNSETCCEYIDLAIKKSLALYGLDKNLGQNGRLSYCKIEGNESSIAYSYGQYTEDTQCTRELLMSIEEGKLNVECFRKKLVSLYGLAGLISWDRNSTVKSGAVGHRDVQPIQNMANGVSWQETGKGEENGSIIRSVPLGALYMNRKDLCKHVSELQAVGTHNSTKARACSVLIAEVTRLAIENKVKPYARYNILKHPRVFCKQLISSIISIEPGLEKYISTIPELLETRKKMIRESKLEYATACILVDRQIVKIISSETAKAFGDKLSHGGETISSSAVQSCIFSIYCFLCVPDFFLSSICMAIRSGGNTTGTAAILGGIVGGRLGLKEIPKYFVDKINDQGNYKSDELIQLCKRLSEQKFSTLDQEPTSQTPMWAPTTTPQQPSTFGTLSPSMFATTPQSLISTPQHPTSMFATPQQSLIGAPQQPTSMFGTPQQPTSMFGSSQFKPLSYAFGQKK